MSAHNPRFVAYARSQGLDPQEVLDRDRERFPGGRMCGFMTWVSERWQAWDRMHKHARDHVRSQAEHDAFDAWLAQGT